MKILLLLNCKIIVQVVTNVIHGFIIFKILVTLLMALVHEHDIGAYIQLDTSQLSLSEHTHH